MQVGSLVECIKPFFPGKYTRMGNVLPVKGKIYTVRGIQNYGSKVGIVLEEIVNPRLQYRDTVGEVHFPSERFRELTECPECIEIEEIIKEKV